MSSNEKENNFYGFGYTTPFQRGGKFAFPFRVVNRENCDKMEDEQDAEERKSEVEESGSAEETQR